MYCRSFTQLTPPLKLHIPSTIKICCTFSVFVFEQIWLSGSGSTKKKLTQRKMGFFGRLKHTKLILYVRAYIFIVLEIHNFELPCNHIWITIPRDCSGFELSSCNKLLFRLIKEISWHS